MGVGAGKASLVGMSWRFVEGVFLGGVRVWGLSVFEIGYEILLIHSL